MKQPSLLLDNILVLGLWHQGIVGSACLANMGYNVTASDLDNKIIESLKKLKCPIYEPNLKNLIEKAVLSENLNFTANMKNSVHQNKIIFLMSDTPVNENDEVILTPIFDIINIIIPELQEGTIICVTAQVPVGTCDELSQIIKKTRPDLNVGIAYIPENLRLGQAISRFYKPEMPVIGTNETWVFDILKKVLKFEDINWFQVDVKTAEMSKHALNTFLATSITFANELGSLCDKVGADGLELAKILRLEPRIGPKAMLIPGLGFSGGTLARDTQVLLNIGKKNNIKTPFFDGLWKANIQYNQIVFNVLSNEFNTLKNLKICILGLTYKPNTSTLRRSIAIATIKTLFLKGASISAYDPMANKEEIEEENNFSFFDNPYDAVKSSDVVVIMTGWKEFKNLDYKLIKSLMNGNYILDTNNMLDFKLIEKIGFKYKGIGRGK